MILETERLYLREIVQDDFNALSKILQDEETMYAYNGAFSDTETQEWLDKQISRYHKYGLGLWAVILKETNDMIGQCGLTIQQWKDSEILEIGYLLQKEYWHNGFTAEAAKACKQYAFAILNAGEVHSIIGFNNKASQYVALHNGMSVIDTWNKHYRGSNMHLYLFSVKRK